MHIFYIHIPSSLVNPNTSGVEVPAPPSSTSYAGISVKGGPKLSLAPAFAVTQAELRSRFQGKNKIDGTLVVQGELSSGRVVYKV